MRPTTTSRICYTPISGYAPVRYVRCACLSCWCWCWCCCAATAGCWCCWCCCCRNMAQLHSRVSYRYGMQLVTCRNVPAQEASLLRNVNTCSLLPWLLRLGASIAILDLRYLSNMYRQCSCVFRLSSLRSFAKSVSGQKAARLRCWGLL